MLDDKINNKLAISELIISLLVGLILFLVLFLYYLEVMPYKYGDTAFLIEVVSNLANGLPPTSKILAQTWAGIKLSSVPLKIYCQQNIAAAMFVTDPYNWLTTLHAYLILYLIAPFALFIGALNTLSFFMALTFSIIPCIAYLYLRGLGISVALSILGSAICIIHPAWQISSGGQFYTDRFFIPFSLLYVLFVHQYFKLGINAARESRHCLYLIVLFGVLGGLISERSMFTIAMFSLVYSMAAQTLIKKKLAIIGFAMLCLIYTFSYLHFIGGSTDNASIQSGLFNWKSLVYAANISGVGEYLLFNLFLLILPALFAPRVFFAVLPIVAINCFITVGGAEKNGWFTHYHSHYYGFMMAAFLIGIANSKDNYGECLNNNIRRFFLPVVASIALTLLLLVPQFYKGQSVFVSLWDYFVRTEQTSSTRAQIKMFEALTQNVPLGATVTTPEWGMPRWYLRGNNVNFFPLGVGQNDYVVVQADGKIPNIKIFSAGRYVGDAELANECIASVISEKYKEIASSGTWVLFKKIQPRSP
jgi:hypothetical protein